MQTPYNSFTSRDRYFSKEFAIPISAYCEVFQEDTEFFEGSRRMDHFDLGKVVSDVKGFVSDVSNVAAKVQSFLPSPSQQLNSGQIGGNPYGGGGYGSYATAYQAPVETDNKIWFIAGGGLLVLVLLIVAFVKLKG